MNFHNYRYSNKEQRRTKISSLPQTHQHRRMPQLQKHMPEKIQDWSHQKNLNRAYNIFSDYASLTTEITRIKQLLIDNNFPNYLVDEVTKEFINKKQGNKLHAQNSNTTKCLKM